MVFIGNGVMVDCSFIEWDKDDIDVLGIFKVDIFVLGMLICICKCFIMIVVYYDEDYSFVIVLCEDLCVYDMLCKGDSVGVFQVESCVQMNMLLCLCLCEFYDLVIEVVIVCFGFIQGDMVYFYLR